MRIYEGTPRQDWEEVLRSVGQFVDTEGLKEILFLEREEGFILQGLKFRGGGAASETLGSLAKTTYDLNDERIAELMEVGHADRGEGAEAPAPDREITDYYELALRILGAYIDSQHPHDVFFFEQDGSFVVRLFGAPGSHGGSHTLAEFTREEILAMIESAQQQRR